MTIITTTRRATHAETAAEMDRRGDVIDRLQAECARLNDALRDIDAVAVDFGHFESAARTMQDIARKAIYQSAPDPGGKE